MPWERYLVRLIHHHTRRAFPGSRLWTAAQLGRESIVKFLRARNRDGYDVYFQPEAFPDSAGYILVEQLFRPLFLAGQILRIVAS